MLPGIIFDLDGTLVDSLPGIADSLNHALEVRGLPTHTPSVIRGFIGNGLPMLVTRAMPPDAPGDLHSELIAAFTEHYDRHWHEGTHVFPGNLQLLDLLQDAGYPLAILSNKTHEFTLAIAERLFSRIRFTDILGDQGDCTPVKPDPGGALRLARAMSRPANGCLIVGDSTIDLHTAENAGMRIVCCTWGYHDEEKLADAGVTRFIHSPGELLHYLP